MGQEERYGSALGRWSSFRPYYAIFPFAFAKSVIDDMAPKSGTVIDPFCVRGTTINSSVHYGEI